MEKFDNTYADILEDVFNTKFYKDNSDKAYHVKSIYNKLTSNEKELFQYFYKLSTVETEELMKLKGINFKKINNEYHIKYNNNDISHKYDLIIMDSGTAFLRGVDKRGEKEFIHICSPAESKKYLKNKYGEYFKYGEILHNYIEKIESPEFEDIRKQYSKIVSAINSFQYELKEFLAEKANIIESKETVQEENVTAITSQKANNKIDLDFFKYIDEQDIHDFFGQQGYFYREINGNWYASKYPIFQQLTNWEIIKCSWNLPWEPPAIVEHFDFNSKNSLYSTYEKQYYDEIDATHKLRTITNCYTEEWVNFLKNKYPDYDKIIEKLKENSKPLYIKYNHEDLKEPHKCQAEIRYNATTPLEKIERRIDVHANLIKNAWSIFYDVEKEYRKKLEEIEKNIDEVKNAKDIGLPYIKNNKWKHPTIIKKISNSLKAMFKSDKPRQRNKSKQNDEIEM